MTKTIRNQQKNRGSAAIFADVLRILSLDFTKKPGFLSDMSGGAILRDFSKMAISRDLGRVRGRAYTQFLAEIRGFLVI